MDKSRPFLINLHYSLHSCEKSCMKFSLHTGDAIRKLFVNVSFHPTWMNSLSFLQLTNAKSDNLYLLLLKQQLFATTDSLSSYFPIPTVLCWRFISVSQAHSRHAHTDTAYQCNGKRCVWITLCRRQLCPSPVCKGSPDRFVSRASLSH